MPINGVITNDLQQTLSCISCLCKLYPSSQNINGIVLFLQENNHRQSDRQYPGPEWQPRKKTVAQSDQLQAGIFRSKIIRKMPPGVNLWSAKIDRVAEPRFTFPVGGTEHAEREIDGVTISKTVNFASRKTGH
jgi:hypothetical protein